MWGTSNVNSFENLFNSNVQRGLSTTINMDLAGIGAWDTSRVTNSRFGARVESYDSNRERMRHSHRDRFRTRLYPSLRSFPRAWDSETNVSRELL